MMITSDYDAYMSTRNTVSCMGQGQAAGTLAAMAATTNVPLRSVPIQDLQARLKEDGVYLGQ